MTTAAITALALVALLSAGLLQHALFRIRLSWARRRRARAMGGYLEREALARAGRRPGALP